MERTISEEERLRRAIEISQRRNNNTYINQRVAKVNVKQKKDYALFKRMFLQIVICLLIYFIYYMITTTNYIFSDDVIKQTSSILNYDINFYELYQKGLNEIKGFIGKWKYENENKDNTSNTTQDNETQEKSKNIAINTNTVAAISMTQEERDIKTLKEEYQFIKPISGKITSGFGERETTSPIMSADHKGIDIAASQGTNIQSAIEGQVEEATSNSEYGKFVKIRKDEVLTVYAHCETLKVSKGNNVKQGDVIATVGSTGKSTGPHLHFEIRLSDRYINPQLVIQF